MEINGQLWKLPKATKMFVELSLKGDLAKQKHQIGTYEQQQISGCDDYPEALVVMGAKKLKRLRLSLKKDVGVIKDKAIETAGITIELENCRPNSINIENVPLTSKELANEQAVEESSDEVLHRSFQSLSGENLVDIEVCVEKISHAVEWLRNNFCVFETGSVARCELHEQYSEYSRRVFQEEPMNMASLGKHVRALFPDVITRRLGHRGNSRYHYYGIAAIKDVPEDLRSKSTACVVPKDANWQKKSKKRTQSVDGKENDSEEESRIKDNNKLMKNTKITKGKVMKTVLQQLYNSMPDNSLSTSKPLPSLILGPSNLGNNFDPTVPNYEDFVRLLKQICSFVQPPNPSPPFCTFTDSYQNHIRNVLRFICERQFNSVEETIRQFWEKLSAEDHALLAKEETIRMISTADDYLYQVAVNMLLPDVLGHYPLLVLQSIRLFTKSYESWMTGPIVSSGFPAIFGSRPLPQRLFETKVELARQFCLSLRRRTSVSHLSHAISGVLTNKSQVNQMIYDWDLIDFQAVRDQSNWIVGVKEPFVSYIEISVKSYLHERATLQAWTQWLENLIEQFIAVEMASGETLDQAAKSLILGWSFYETLIMRDLTLRNASSFGSFHLFRLLFEEYLLYYVEKKLDEHRRAVGVLAFWPLNEDAGMVAYYDSFGKEEEKNVSPEEGGKDKLLPSAVEGLHLMTSVADLPSEDENAHPVPMKHHAIELLHGEDN